MMTKMDWPPQPKKPESGDVTPLVVEGEGGEVLEVKHLTREDLGEVKKENKFKGILGTGLKSPDDYLKKVNQERGEQGLPPIESIDEVQIVDDESEDGEELKENVG